MESNKKKQAGNIVNSNKKGTDDKPVISWKNKNIVVQLEGEYVRLNSADKKETKSTSYAKESRSNPMVVEKKKRKKK